jgi:hypothetical protein
VPSWLLAAAVALLSSLPYLGVGGYGFVDFDDDLYVYGNAVVRNGLTLDGVKWAFTSFHAGNWHPLTWISHMADVSLFGPWAGGHHGTNVLLHALSSALLFLALRRMTGNAWRSAFAAALFGVHPLHVESVAWVAERKDVLSGLFFSLGLLAYGGYARKGGAWRYVAVAACLTLGLLSKPMLVTFPFLLLLLDYWPLGRVAGSPPPADGTGTAPVPLSRLVVEKAPLFLLAAASCVVTYAAQAGGGMVKPVSFLYPSERIANALVSLAAYLGKAFVPVRLAVLYPFPYDGIPPWKPVAASLLLLAATVLAVRARRTSPWLAVGWFWFVGTLVPVIGLVQVGNQAMADRYTYIPLVGIFLAVAWEGWARLSALLPGAGRGASAATAAAVLAACLALSALQARHWRDTVTLFSHAIDATGENCLMQNGLGAELYRQKRYAEAEGHFREAIRIRPDHADAHNNLGILLVVTGLQEEGVAHMREAVRIGNLIRRQQP